MFKKLFAFVFFASITMAANAQFGALGGALGGAKGGGGPSPEKLMTEYFAGTSSILHAQSLLLSAVGLKGDADIAASNAANMKEGATTDSIKEAQKIQTENSLKIQEALSDKKLKLDANAKKQLVEGYKNLALGAIAYIVFIKDAKDFKPSATSIGGAALALATIVPRIPEDVKNLMSSFESIGKFAKESKIQLPPNDATKDLGSLVS